MVRAAAVSDHIGPRAFTLATLHALGGCCAAAFTAVLHQLYRSCTAGTQQLSSCCNVAAVVDVTRMRHQLLLQQPQSVSGSGSSYNSCSSWHRCSCVGAAAGLRHSRGRAAAELAQSCGRAGVELRQSSAGSALHVIFASQLVSPWNQLAWGMGV